MPLVWEFSSLCLISYFSLPTPILLALFHSLLCLFVCFKKNPNLPILSYLNWKWKATALCEWLVDRHNPPRGSLVIYRTNCETAGIPMLSQCKTEPLWNCWWWYVASFACVEFHWVLPSSGMWVTSGFLNAPYLLASRTLPSGFSGLFPHSERGSGYTCR